MQVDCLLSLNDDQMPSMERIDLLQDLLQEEARRPITMEKIQKRVAEHFELRLGDMTSKRRPKNIASPASRHVPRSQPTKGSLHEIATPSAGITGPCCMRTRLVKDRMQKDEKTRQVVSFLDSQLQR